MSKEKKEKLSVPDTSQRGRRLTLQNLLAAGSEIWVRNNSGKLTGRDAGNIVVQVGDGNMIDIVVIPPGNDPVCLTDQVTPKLLAECMDLFKLVKSGALEILDPVNANDYYDQNQERKKIVEDKINNLLTQKRDEDTSGARPKPKLAAQTTIHVNQKVGDICLKAKHAAISEQEALERMFEQESVLTLDDYNYIMMNGVFNGVKSWAKEQAKKVMAQ